MNENNIKDQLFVAYEYFFKEQHVFDAISKADKKIESIERFRGKNDLFIFLGFIGFIVYCWKNFLRFSGWFLDGSTITENIFEYLKTLLPTPLVIILALILMFVCFVGIYCLIFFVILTIINILKNLITQPSYNSQILKIAEGNARIEEVYGEYENVIMERCPVAIDWCHPALIEQITDFIASQRADTVKEAINLIIQDEHNKKVIQLEQQKIHELNQMKGHLKDISKNTRRIERNTFWR